MKSRYHIIYNGLDFYTKFTEIESPEQKIGYLKRNSNEPTYFTFVLENNDELFIPGELFLRCLIVVEKSGEELETKGATQ